MIRLSRANFSSIGISKDEIREASLGRAVDKELRRFCTWHGER
jgi:hypothetical protein